MKVVTFFANGRKWQKNIDIFHGTRECYLSDTYNQAAHRKYNIDIIYINRATSSTPGHRTPLFKE